MTVTKEQIDAMVADAREAVRLDREQPGLPFRKYEMKNEKLTRVVAALADQRAELVALLKDCARHIVWADDVVNTDYNKSEKYREVDAENFLDASEALLARIGVTP